MPRLEFQEAGHLYLLDGLPIPSNTQILKAERMVDDRFYTDAGRERGVNVHNACWFLDEDDLDWSTVSDEEKGFVEGFGEFKVKTGFKTDFNELAVWGNSLFATRLDLIGVLNGVRVIIDLKTGQVDRWVGLQLAGQQIAITDRIRENQEPWVSKLSRIDGHPYPVKRFALKLNKNATYKLIPFPDNSEMDVFNGLVRTHHWRRAA